MEWKAKLSDFARRGPCTTEFSAAHWFGFQLKMFSLSHNRTQSEGQENKRSDHQQENLCRSALGDV